MEGELPCVVLPTSPEEGQTQRQIVLAEPYVPLPGQQDELPLVSVIVQSIVDPEQLPQRPRKKAKSTKDRWIPTRTTAEKLFNFVGLLGEVGSRQTKYDGRLLLWAYTVFGKPWLEQHGAVRAARSSAESLKKTDPKMSQIPKHMSEDCPLKRLSTDPEARREFEEAMLTSHRAEMKDPHCQMRVVAPKPAPPDEEIPPSRIVHKPSGDVSPHSMDYVYMQKLLAQGALMHPAQGPNLVDLANGIALSAGIQPTIDHGTRGVGPSAQMAHLLGDSEHLLVVVVEGLPSSMLAHHLPADSFLNRNNKAGLMRSVFPSSPASCLEALLSGCWPSTYASTVDANPASKWNGLRGVNEHPAFECQAFLPENSRSCMIKEFWAGFPQTEYSSLNDMVVGAISWMHQYHFSMGVLQQGSGFERKRMACFAYVSTISQTARKFGCLSKQVKDALVELNKQLETLYTSLNTIRGIKMVVTAAGGQSDTSPIFLATPGVNPVDWESEYGTMGYPDLMELVSGCQFMESGQGRMAFFEVPIDARRRFEFHFRSTFGDCFALLDQRETQNLCLFGGSTVPYSWDYMVIALNHSAFLLGPEEDGSATSCSGSLTMDEMSLPLLLLHTDDLQPPSAAQALPILQPIPNPPESVFMQDYTY